jgi:hypothetical protein
MIKSMVIGLLLGIAVGSSAQAQSVSPDGTILIKNCTTAAGTWSFGAPASWAPGNWWINLNGQSAAGVGSQLVVANGGMVYTLGTDGNWYLWVGGWTWVGQPALPSPLTTPMSTPAPDGSTLLGSLRTAAGTWTFGPQWSPGNWYICLNSQSAGGGIGSELVVANGGQVYTLCTDGSWYVWQNGGWVWGAANPLLTQPAATPPVAATLTLTFNPQFPSIPNDTPLGTVVARVTGAWSDGSPFTGTLMFAAPYADDGGTFALSCTQCSLANLVINPIGMGFFGDGGTVHQVTVVATQ